MMDGTATVAGYGSRGDDQTPERPCTRSGMTAVQLEGGQIARFCGRMDLPMLVGAAGGSWA